MKHEERKQRLALTIWLAAVTFVFMMVSALISALIGYILVRTGIITIIDNTLLASYKLIILMTANSLVIGGIISALASRYPLKPVNKIVSQMNRLASGDFKARLEMGKYASKHSTIKEITTSFNKMAEELENTEMLRQDFINNFSHEFKTPIVSIAGFAKLLKRGNLTEEQKAEYIAIIEEESIRLSEMATNVLNMTKIENQAILTEITEFNLSEQIRNSVLLLEGKWAKKNIEFSMDFGEYYIQGNEDMVKHIWLNLIDNAIKFSEDYSTVELKISDKGDSFSVSVANTGITIPNEIQGRIFNKFYQGDESHSSEGNGIGLALVKSITKLHKGDITVQSENNRTVFTVSLPKIQ